MDYLPSAALKQCVVGLLAFRCVETMAAEWLVGIFFSEEHQLVALGKTVGMVGRAAAFHADGVDFLDIFSNCHKGGHRTERLAGEIHIEAGNDYPYTSVSKFLHNLHDCFIKELSLVNSDHFHIA